MFFNPFSKTFTVFVVIPLILFERITYLLHHPLKLVGLSKRYKRLHGILFMNIEQLALQGKVYFKNFKAIYTQILNESKENQT